MLPVDSPGAATRHYLLTATADNPANDSPGGSILPGLFDALTEGRAEGGGAMHSVRPGASVPRGNRCCQVAQYPTREGALATGKPDDRRNPRRCKGLRAKGYARSPMDNSTPRHQRTPGWPPKPKRLISQSRSWIFSPLGTPKVVTYDDQRHHI